MVISGTKLTAREAAVVSKIIEGKGNKEIARDLGCSTKTVELHASNVFRKVGVKSRLELACKVLNANQGDEHRASREL
jgi:DNA-binding NarL/FixJ family response regulator